MRVARWLGVLVGLSVGGASAGVASAVSAEEITVATGEWSPFISEKLPDGGPYSKVVKDFFASKGVTVKLEFTNWKRAYELTKSGGFIASYAWFKTPERVAETLLAERPVAQAENVVFHKASLPTTDLSSLESIAKSGRTVVGVGGYWYEAELKKLGAKMETVGDVGRAFALLGGGRADLLIETKEVGIVEGSEALGEEVMKTIIYSPSIKTDSLHIVFSRAHPDGEKYLKLWEGN